MHIFKKKWFASIIVVILIVAAAFLGGIFSVRGMRNRITDSFWHDQNDAFSVQHYIEQVITDTTSLNQLAEKYAPALQAHTQSVATDIQNLSAAKTQDEKYNCLNSVLASLEVLYESVPMDTFNYDDRLMLMGSYASLTEAVYAIEKSAYNSQVAAFNTVKKTFPMNALSTLSGVGSLKAFNGFSIKLTDAEIEKGNYDKATHKFTAMDYVNAFVEAGLPLQNIQNYDEHSDPNNRLGRPGQYTSKVNFADSRVEQYDKEDPLGGMLEVFETVQDMEKRKLHIEEIYEIMPPLEDAYMFISPDGLALLRIDFTLTKMQAEQYKAVFDAYCTTGKVTPIE